MKSCTVSKKKKKLYILCQHIFFFKVSPSSLSSGSGLTSWFLFHQGTLQQGANCWGTVLRAEIGSGPPTPACWASMLWVRRTATPCLSRYHRGVPPVWSMSTLTCWCSRCVAGGLRRHRHQRAVSLPQPDIGGGGRRLLQGPPLPVPVSQTQGTFYHQLALF